MESLYPNLETYEGNDAVIIHGNALDALPTIPDQSVDLVFADPPYNIGKKIGDFIDKWKSVEEYVAWCHEWLEECIRVLKSDGSMYVMTSTQSMPYLDIWLRERIHVKSRIVWHYDSSGVQARKYFGSLYEPILHCTKHQTDYTFNANDIAVEARTGAIRNLIDYRKATPAPYSSTKVPGNAWYIPRVRYKMQEYEEHPSQKPRALMERIIKASSNEDDMILDPFSGTFTTSSVAQKLKRKSVGIEMQLRYVKIGLRTLGIATHFNGKLLTPPRKSHARKNVRQPVSTHKLTTLFDDSTGPFSS